MSCKTFLKAECRASALSSDFPSFNQVINLSFAAVVVLITGLNVHSHVDSGLVCSNFLSLLTIRKRCSLKNPP